MTFELLFEKTDTINDINVVEVAENKYEIMCKDFVCNRPVMNVHIKNDKGTFVASTDTTKKLPCIVNSCLESVVHEFNQTRKNKLKIKNIINIKSFHKQGIFLVL